MARSLDRFPSTWLLLGTLLIAAAHMRFGVGILAWLAPVPLLHYLRLTRGWKSRALFFASQFAAWTLAAAKLMTDPVPLATAPLYGLPLMLFLGVPYLVWDGVRRRTGDGWWAAGAFASAMALAEWLQHTATPFASWGAVAYSQVENLPLLQLVAVTGIAGVAFLLYGTAAVLERALTHGLHASRTPLAVAATTVVLVLALGGLRLSAVSARGGETITVAAIGTDLTITPEGALPTAAELAEVEAAQVERTRAAVDAGARMVVWNEAAMLVMPEDEPAFLERVSALGGELGIELVVGYVIPVSMEPFRYENRYAWVRPDGTVDHTYDKHHPVAGEPAIPGSGPMPVVESELGLLSGAICYDYDFPRLALEQARAGVDLVAVPSSDWRGIDPIHTQMAAVRAIEGGHSILRSTRWGLSAGIDHTGRARGWLSYFDDPRKILVVQLPRHGVRTVYSALGDWFIGLSALLLLGSLAASWYHGRRAFHGPERGQSSAGGRLSADGAGRGPAAEGRRSVA